MVGLQRGLSGPPSLAEVVVLGRKVVARVGVVYGIVRRLVQAVDGEGDAAWVTCRLLDGLEEEVKRGAAGWATEVRGAGRKVLLWGVAASSPIE